MLINAGSVDDIRSSLKHAEASITIEQLREELAAEKNRDNRSTVIKLLEAAIRRKTKTK